MSDRRLLWLLSLATEHELTTAQSAVLAYLLALDARERAHITKAELGALAGLKERQVSTVLLQLEGKLAHRKGSDPLPALIKKQRNGGAGKGRVANSYLIRPDATGNPVPAGWCQQQPSAGTASPDESSNQQACAGGDSANQQPSTGTVLPVAREQRENSPPPKEIKTPLELNPEKVEASGECVAIEMPIGAGDLNLNWVISDTDRAFANNRGYLNGTCDELFGHFLDHCATKGPRQSAYWRSEWQRWVRNQVRFDSERAQRNKSSGASDEQRTGSQHSYASAGRRRARSVETEILMRDILDGPADGDGRLAALPSK